MTSDKTVNVTIAFRGTEPSDALRGYVAEKVHNCIQKFVHHNMDAHVVLKVEKTRQIAEVSFRTDGADFAAVEESDDMYGSIDKMCGNVHRQLGKHKEKITSHHKG